MDLIKPLTKRQQRSLQTKQKIYDSAMDLIYKYGFEKVTINDICAQAGIKVGTFYHFYSSKDDVLITYVESEDRHITSILNDLPPEPNSLRFKELFMAKVTIATISKTPELAGFCRIAHIKNKVYASYSNERAFYKALLAEIVTGMENGEFKRDIDPIFVVETTLYLIDGLNSAWQLSGGTLDVLEKANRQVDNILKMMSVNK